jgi:hypothetical protein
MFETRVFAIHEDVFDANPTTPQFQDFDLLRLCTRIFPRLLREQDDRLEKGACFSNAGMLAFERRWETVLCFVVGPDDKVYPHAVVRDAHGVAYEVSPGNDSMGQYYAYCAVTRSDYVQVLTALGTSVEQFLSEPRWFISLNERGDLILPFTAENRLDRPTVYRDDKFVVEMSATVSGHQIQFRD